MTDKLRDKHFSGLNYYYCAQPDGFDYSLDVIRVIKPGNKEFKTPIINSWMTAVLWYRIRAWYEIWSMVW